MATYPLRIAGIYLAPGQGEDVGKYDVWPPSESGIFPAKENAVEVGTEVGWPGLTNVQGAIKIGTPPGGDYVPEGRAGLNYQSPGYLSGERIVFVGDSITDGHTYPQLVRQALQEAGLPVPTVINAAAGGDTAKAMLARLDRDALALRPTLVMLHAGANDVARGVTSQEFEADITAIAERLRQEKLPAIILTTCITGPANIGREPMLANYDDILRKVARQYGFGIAEVTERMKEARAAGQQLIEADGTHPNYAGQHVIARAVLDALGRQDVPLPSAIRANLMEGVITSWLIRVAPTNEALDEKSAPLLQPDNSWTAYTLPETLPEAAGWLVDHRDRGFALSLDKLVGPGHAYQGVAHLDIAAPRTVYFNTGAGLQTVWLDGTRIYKTVSWHGFHAGRDRIPVDIAAGHHTIAIETSSQFFLSVTDNNDW